VDAKTGDLTLTSTDDAGPAVRPVGHALLLALPAIGLMTLILWTFVLMSAMSLALFVDLEIIGVVFFLLMFGVPAGWANLAYGSARHRRRAPHAADRISAGASRRDLPHLPAGAVATCQWGQQSGD
jgi:hypothetical protein